MVDRYLQRHVKLIHTGVCRPDRAGLRAASWCLLQLTRCTVWPVSSTGQSVEWPQIYPIAFLGVYRAGISSLLYVNDGPFGLEK